MIGFAHPWAFLGLLTLPIVAWLRHRRRRHVPGFPPLQYAGSTRSHGARRAARGAVAGLELAVTALLVVAVAGPYTETRFERVDDEGIDIVLVLDVSLSMLAEDFPPNRLAALQGIARDFLARSGGHRLGLVIFAGDTYVQSPLTDDRIALSSLLENVSVHAVNQSKGGGTAVGDALLVAVDALERQRVEGRDQAVVLITDGESNKGVDPGLAARYARRAGVRLYAVGIGSETPQEVYFQGERVGGDTPFLASLDDTGLRQLTEVAEGRYFRATDAGALSEIFGELSRLESAPLETRTVVRRQHAVHRWALGVLVALAALYALELLALGRPWR